MFIEKQSIFNEWVVNLTLAAEIITLLRNLFFFGGVVLIGQSGKAIP